MSVVDKTFVAVPGDVYGNESTQRLNKTGATLSVGALGFVDLPQGNAASTTIPLGQYNIVAVSTALIAVGQLVVSRDAPADATPGFFYEGECIRCKIRVERTVAIAKGDPLKPVNAQNYAVKATAGTDRWYAIALEAAGSSAGAFSTIECLLYSSGRF